jgi:hypothetical protein
MKLFPQKEFHEASVEWLKEFDLNDFTQLSEEARSYAEEHCSWKHTVSNLIIALQESIKEA